MLQYRIIIIKIKWADIDLILILQMLAGYALRFSFLVMDHATNIIGCKHLDKYQK
jgi:hypothetical protein